jgi:hypothetical protein
VVDRRIAGDREGIVEDERDGKRIPIGGDRRQRDGRRGTEPFCGSLNAQT